MNSILKNCLFLLCFLTAGCASTGSYESADSKRMDIYLNAGNEALIKGEYSEALISLTEALKYGPDNYVIWNNLGVAYSGRGQPAKAEEAWKKALALNKKNSDARNNLGVLYFQQKRYKDAERELNLAANDLLYSKAAQSHFNLALLYFEIGKRIPAESELKKALEVNSYYCPAWYKLGLIQRDRGDLEKAITSLKSSVNGTCYKNPEAHYEIANLLLKARNIKAAKSKFLEVIELFPESDWAKKSELTLNLLH